ncbi:hypothetical protein EGR_07114 [Echinococcus granulosus]|uniref:Uncharacterized protein n=1 Tax=Echinococcus granulosus TaxID=6210 RepID=W6U9G6_ECHGR|nr:hypothetical protein EGR_07114 [Echinococcus granulosus]EUB58008.1 hypothetical protein EGR_07114 [Echinococcus granulosus]
MPHQICVLINKTQFSSILMPKSFDNLSIPLQQKKMIYILCKKVMLDFEALSLEWLTFQQKSFSLRYQPLFYLLDGRWENKMKFRRKECRILQQPVQNLDVQYGIRGLKFVFIIHLSCHISSSSQMASFHSVKKYCNSSVTGGEKKSSSQSRGPIVLLMPNGFQKLHQKEFPVLKMLELFVPTH